MRVLTEDQKKEVAALESKIARVEKQIPRIDRELIPLREEYWKLFSKNLTEGLGFFERRRFKSLHQSIEELKSEQERLRTQIRKYEEKATKIKYGV